MVQLAGGDFDCGSDDHYPEERPRHRSHVSAFAIDVCAVSNAEFATFVRETDYVTTAETPIDPASVPAMPPEYFAAGSLVFRMTDGPVDLHDFRQWWEFQPDANWRHPEGPHSTIDGRQDHPVVQVSLFDAQAYADWAGKSLLGEKQWEFAARDGVETDFPWGEELTTGTTIHANTWHGAFPHQNLYHHTTPFTVPVDAFEPSRYGLFNMIGNVWEWTTDSYTAAHDPDKSCCTPARVEGGRNFTVKGGSFLCAPSYCCRYRAAARSPQEARSSTSHLGFRCIARAAD
ncbi:MAG: formylglycine-generating enzyme family protein [Paracoccaceae bacterium]